MNIKTVLISCMFASLLLVAACAPISEETLSRVDRDVSLAMVHESPDSWVGKQLLLGGSVVSIESEKDSTVLEILEWHLNSYGEPLHVNEAGLKFLVKTSSKVDHIDETGMLVTLAGVLAGKETRSVDGTEYTYPVFGLTEIHLWDIPYRYGIHRNQDPGYPIYPGATDTETRNPYDPGYWDYPYSPHDMRRLPQ